MDHQRFRFPLKLALILLLPAVSMAQRDTPNVADPEVYPYSNPNAGREGHRYEDHPINEFRLYDFYQRQADYYIANGNVPEIIPSYPGMEAGINGHWGRYNHFDLFSNIWARMDNGPIVTSVIRQGPDPVVKAINLRLGNNQDLFASFDQLTLGYRMVWKDDFLKYPEIRWGMMGLVEPATTPLLQSWETAWSKSTHWPQDYEADNISYKGFFRYRNRSVFSYQVHDTPVLESPDAIRIEEDAVFIRTLHFPEGANDLNLKFFKLPAEENPSTVLTSKELLLSSIKLGEGSYGLAAKSSSTLDGISIELSNDGYFYLAISQLDAGTTLTTYAWNIEEDLAIIQEGIEEH
ncbi:MAG: hypothetical protein P8L44_16695, partial [Opitutales bacterium]|nr:hypothetical protein [Opitutales bacterium]